MSDGYTYVKMSLLVPWTLYFVFLVCVLIPFVLMIVLAWRNASRRNSAEETADAPAPAPVTPPGRPR